MNKFQPHINVDYPHGNNPIFEEWFAENYKSCETDRELMPFFPTSYWVNNNYAQDKLAYAQAIYYIDQLDKNKKYFVICQYDDGCLIDFESMGLDVLQFNMSKKVGIEIPLICQPHPHKFNSEKKYFASFVGSRTHPIRNELEQFKDLSGWYISFEPHDTERYCEILHQSVFTLCPRGYGSNSFRACEALQYNSAIAYISDEFIIPCHPLEFPGVLVKPDEVNNLPSILETYWMNNHNTLERQIKTVYNYTYTYEGLFKKIKLHLETEYEKRRK